MPERIQRRRTKGWRLPDGAVSVTRPSEFGNPFRVSRLNGHPDYDWWVEYSTTSVWFFKTKVEAADAAVRLYRHWIDLPQNHKLRARARLALHGKNLACFCRLEDSCHADVLLSISNE